MGPLRKTIPLDEDLSSKKLIFREIVVNYYNRRGSQSNESLRHKDFGSM